MQEQWNYLLADLKRWKVSGLKDYFYLIFEQGIWATILYRMGRALFLLDIPFLKFVFKFVGFLLFKFSETFLGVSLPPSADIGPGLYLGHTYYIRFHPAARIGKNLNIGPGVIIGQKGLGEKDVPRIGDNVYIGTGAKLLGRIDIGNDCVIGANAVVIENVADGMTVGGVPAKIIGKGKARTEQ